MMIRLLAVAVLAATFMPSRAFASEGESIKESYIGIEIGSQTSEILEKANENCAGDCFDEKSTSISFLVGQNFNDHVAIEGGIQYSSASYNFHTRYQNYNGDLSLMSFTVGPKLQVSPTDSFHLFAKPGIAYSTMWDSNDNSGDYDENSFGFMLALGAEVDVTESFALRASWEVIQAEVSDVSNDMTAAKIGAIFRF